MISILSINSRHRDVKNRSAYCSLDKQIKVLVHNGHETQSIDGCVTRSIKLDWYFGDIPVVRANDNIMRFSIAFQRIIIRGMGEGKDGTFDDWRILEIGESMGLHS